MENAGSHERGFSSLLTRYRDITGKNRLLSISGMTTNVTSTSAVSPMNAARMPGGDKVLMLTVVL
jgi:hypothetical protein